MRVLMSVLVLGGGGLANAQPLGFAELRVPDDPQVAASAQALAANNTFVRFQRDPAEDHQTFVFENMRDLGGGPEAYFRDHFVLAETFHSAPTNGDEWTAFALLPPATPGGTGRTIAFDTIRYLDTLNGQSRCFINLSTNRAVCGATSITISWFTRAQCLETGTWIWQLFYNNDAWASPTHTLKPQIPPGAVDSLSQGPYNDPTDEFHHYDHWCERLSDDVRLECPPPIDTQQYRPALIRDYGCLMTAMVNTLRYHEIVSLDTGAPFAPDTYNDRAKAIVSNNPFLAEGYNDSGEVTYDLPAAIAADQGSRFEFYGRAESVDLGVWDDRFGYDTAICADGPQIIQLGDTHFGTAVGRTLSEPSRFIYNDPDGGAREQLRSSPVESARYFHGPGGVVSFNGGLIYLSGRSPIEMMVTDEAGRRTGRVPGGTTLQEIPEASEYYDFFGTQTPPPVPLTLLARQLKIHRPADGRYHVDVVGTAVGTYTLIAETQTRQGAVDRSRREFRDVPISTGEVHSFDIQYSNLPGTASTYSGGFDGGGQRPTDVNKFLSYVTPSRSRTNLDVGAAEARVVISYGAGVLTSTFSGRLDGADISDRFHPEPGRMETVVLPLASGSHTLVLSIDGTLPTGRVATDTDRLVFLVP